MTKSKLYPLIKNITPPFIFVFLKKGKIYNILKNKLSKILNREYKPQWNIVSDGVLKGKKLYFDPKQYWQKEMLDGSYDKFIFDYLKKINMSEKIIFDIGAHIGFHSLCFAEIVGPKGKVYSFEPNPSNAEKFKYILTENIDLSERITLCEVAISDKNGKDILISSDSTEDGLSSMGFINSADTQLEKEVYEKEIGFMRSETKTIKLDNIDSELKIKDVPYLIKIDVEGAEGLIINGGKEFLKKFRPIIIAEVHSIMNMFSVVNTLKELDYKIEILNKERDGRCFICATP